MENETLEQVQKERDILIRISSSVQDNLDKLNQVVNLLIAAGHLSEVRYAQAKAIVEPLKA